MSEAKKSGPIVAPLALVAGIAVMAVAIVMNNGLRADSTATLGQEEVVHTDDHSAPQDADDQSRSDVGATPGEQPEPAWFMPPASGTWDNNATLGEDCYAGNDPHDPCTAQIGGRQVTSQLRCVVVEDGYLSAMPGHSTLCNEVEAARMLALEAAANGHALYGAEFDGTLNLNP